MDDIKQQIIDTVSGMLREGKTAEEITIREITSRMGISVSTINYHFQSKENLMRTVIQKHVDGVIGQVPRMLEPLEGQPPRQKLGHMVKMTADYLASFPSLSRISILSDLQDGHNDDNSFSTIAAYDPLVRAIVGPERAALCGLFLCFSIQGIFLRTDVLKEQGVDFSDKEERHRLVDELLDTVLGEPLKNSDERQLTSGQDML